MAFFKLLFFSKCGFWPGMLVLFCFASALPAQSVPLRAAYQFGSGRAWSASVERPQYGILDLGADRVPLAVTDSGIVLLRNADNELIRWTWGKEEILRTNFTIFSTAFLNEGGRAVSLEGGDNSPPQIRTWAAGQALPALLDWGDHLLASPYNLVLNVLNDENELIFKSESRDGWTFVPPETVQIETNVVNLLTNQWTELSMYEYYNDTEFTLTQGGRTYKVADNNNYGDTVGFVYEDAATSSAWEPDPVYSFQNEFFAFNGHISLSFEPLQVNDHRTILGRTPGPLHGMVILDAFGQRDLGPVIEELAMESPLLNSPDDGLEEIVLGKHYWKRMTERNLEGVPTGQPSPDFWQGTLSDIIRTPGGWSDLRATGLSRNGRIAGTGFFSGSGTARHAFMTVGNRILVDHDRNGNINTNDRKWAWKGSPWRFWINGDDDLGDLARNAQDDAESTESPDWSTPGIDGLRDVVDFFPVLLDLQEILQAIGDVVDVEVVLKQADSALNFAYTNLLPSQAGQVHTENPGTGFGSTFTEPLAMAATEPITDLGVPLQKGFLRNILETNRGVLLVEARKASLSPLVMELFHQGRRVLTCSLPLSLAPVRDMFRIINLRNSDIKFAAVDPGPWLTDTREPPNLPDGWLASIVWPLRTLVHLHGYNWGGDEVPAAHAEVFKRFFQAGSSARYVGVTWRGDEGTLILTDSSFEYNENVINAFITARTMTAALAPFTGPFTAIFAHSLGNMVASSAISDHALDAAHYFMVNAAVPTEAYLGESADRRLMVHPEWKDQLGLIPDYAEWLLSPNWWWLFPPEDHRSLLKWKDRFAGLTSRTRCLNFYSSGEDVLKSGTGDLPNLFGEVYDKEQVWTFNEMVKGTNTLSANLAGEVHGGWGFNRAYMDWVDPGGAAHPPPGSWVEMSPTEADTLSPEMVATEPFFHRFSSGDADFPAWGDGQWLYGAAQEANARLPGLPFRDSSMDLLKNHAKILSEGIPAHSAPTGSQALAGILLLSNFDMDAVIRKTGHWPVREPSEKRDRWLHSDYLYPAFPYVFPLYRICSQTLHYIP